MIETKNNYSKKSFQRNEVDKNKQTDNNRYNEKFGLQKNRSRLKSNYRAVRSQAWVLQQLGRNLNLKKRRASNFVTSPNCALDRRSLVGHRNPETCH